MFVLDSVAVTGKLVLHVYSFASGTYIALDPLVYATYM